MLSGMLWLPDDECLDGQQIATTFRELHNLTWYFVFRPFFEREPLYQSQLSHRFGQCDLKTLKLNLK